MKAIFSIVVLAAALNANASSDSTYVCKADVQDASLTVTLDVAANKASVFVPTGEFTGKTYSKDCDAPQSSIEFSRTCNVFMSTDSGYQLDFYSAGGASVQVRASRWNMAGPGVSVVLPCN